MLALGVHGMSVVTAVTAQNSLGVQGAWELPAEAVRAQYRSVVDDIGVQAVKTGMLVVGRPRRDGRRVARRHGRPCGRRPGRRLQARRLAARRRRRWTPYGRSCCRCDRRHAEPGRGGPAHRRTRSSRRTADAGGPRRPCSRTGRVGADQGRSPARGDAVDLLTDGSEEHWLRAPRHDNRHTHGTGCTLASAIASARRGGSRCRRRWRPRRSTSPGRSRRGSRSAGGSGRWIMGGRFDGGFPKARFLCRCASSSAQQPGELCGHGKKPAHTRWTGLSSEPAVAAR